MLFSNVRWVFCLILCGLVLVGCANSTISEQVLDSGNRYSLSVAQEQGSEAIYRIGLHTDVTGDGAQLGDLTVRAAQLAVEEVNAAGGINGIPVRLTVRDNKGSSEVNINSYNAAIEADNLVAMLGPQRNSFATELVAVHGDNPLPLFLNSTNGLLTESGEANLFRMRPSSEFIAETMVAYASSELTSQRVVIVHDTGVLGREGAERIEQAILQSSLTLVENIAFDTAENNVDRFVDQLIGVSADTIFIYTSQDSDIGHILRNINLLNLDANIITSPGGATSTVQNLAGVGQDGVIVVTNDMLNHTEQGRIFADNFYARHQMTADSSTIWTYDAIFMLVEILQEYPFARDSVLTDLLKAESINGIQGEYQFLANGDGLNRAAIIKMQDGTAQVLGFYEAAQYLTAP